MEEKERIDDKGSTYSLSAQVYLAAGPRKNISNDTELGEDVAGVKLVDNSIFFWILDGTSDSIILSVKNDYKDFKLEHQESVQNDSVENHRDEITNAALAETCQQGSEPNPLEGNANSGEEKIDVQLSSINHSGEIAIPETEETHLQSEERLHEQEEAINVAEEVNLKKGSEVQSDGDTNAESNEKSGDKVEVIPPGKDLKEKSGTLINLFSSRILAMEIANQLMLTTFEINKQDIEKIIGNIEKPLLERINKHLHGEKREKLIERLNGGYQYVVSSTMIVGKFSLNGTLEYIQIGNSELSSLPPDVETESVSNNGQVVMGLTYDREEDCFRIRTILHEENLQPRQKFNLDEVFIYSDWLSSNFKLLLKTASTEGTEANNPIFQYLKSPQKTYDDKSLIYVQRRKVHAS